MLGAVSMMKLMGKIDRETSDEVKKAVEEYTEDELVIEDKDFKLAMVMSALSEICRISETKKSKYENKRKSERFYQ